MPKSSGHDVCNGNLEFRKLAKELGRPYVSKVIAGYFRHLIKGETDDTSIVLVDLCTEFVVEPVFQTEADDPVNFISELDEETSDCYKDKGNQYFKAKEYERAMVKYTTALRFNPNNHLLFSNRAFCHYLLSNYGDALEDIERCLVIEPAFAKGWFRYALILEQLGDLNRAGVSYLRAMQLSEFEMNTTSGAMQKSNNTRICRHCTKRFHEFERNLETNTNNKAMKFLKDWQRGRRPGIHQQIEGDKVFFLDVMWMKMKIYERVSANKMRETFKDHPKYLKMRMDKEFAIKFEQSRYKECVQIERDSIGSVFSFYDGEIGWEFQWDMWTIQWSSDDRFSFNKRNFTLQVHAGDARLEWTTICGKPTADQVINILLQKMTYIHVDSFVKSANGKAIPPLKGIKPRQITISWQMKSIFGAIQDAMSAFGIICVLAPRVHNERLDGYDHLDTK